MMVSSVKIPVIYFHSVQDARDPLWMRNFLTMELSCFELVLCYLSSNGWQTLFLDEMHELRKKAAKPKGKYCCLTFDDGYLDNYIFAYPLLKKYGLKGTIFVSPECVDLNRNKSATLFDVWDGRQDLRSLVKSAYLNWDEMREMQNSGVIDIQSHTMSHTKYFSSDKLVSFHHPGDNCFYPIINRYPQTQTTYFRDPGFEKLIPYGTPLFAESSAVITRKFEIDTSFEQATTALTEPLIRSGGYDVSALMELVKPTYTRFRAQKQLLFCAETDTQYEERLHYEIAVSKAVLEKELCKEVNFLCWPHGDNTTDNHKLAIQAGYKATTVGKSNADPNSLDRFERTGIHVCHLAMLTRLGIRYKLRSLSGRFPEYLIREWRMAWSR